MLVLVVDQINVILDGFMEGSMKEHAELNPLVMDCAAGVLPLPFATTAHRELVHKSLEPLGDSAAALKGQREE